MILSEDAGSKPFKFSKSDHVGLCTYHTIFLNRFQFRDTSQNEKLRDTIKIVLTFCIDCSTVQKGERLEDGNYADRRVSKVGK